MCDKECHTCNIRMSEIKLYRCDNCHITEVVDVSPDVSNDTSNYTSAEKSQSIIHMAHQSMSYRDYSNYEYVNYDDSDCNLNDLDRSVYYPDNQFYMQSDIDPIISIQINEP